MHSSTAHIFLSQEKIFYSDNISQIYPLRVQLSIHRRNNYQFVLSSPFSNRLSIVSFNIRLGVRNVTSRALHPPLLIPKSLLMCTFSVSRNRHFTSLGTKSNFYRICDTNQSRDTTAFFNRVQQVKVTCMTDWLCCKIFRI